MHRVESVLVERHVGTRFDDEFRRDGGRRISYLGEGALGENTAIGVSKREQEKRMCKRDGRDGARGWVASGPGEGRRDSHQQTRFSASTVADNDELSTEFSSHLGESGGSEMRGMGKRCRLVEQRRREWWKVDEMTDTTRMVVMELGGARLRGVSMGKVQVGRVR